MVNEITFTAAGRTCRIVRVDDGWQVASPDLDDVKAYGALTGWDDSTLRLVALAEGIVAGVISPDEVGSVNRKFARWPTRHQGLHEPSHIWMWTYKPAQVDPTLFQARPPVADALARRVADLPGGAATAARLTGDTEMLSCLVAEASGASAEQVKPAAARNVAASPGLLRSLADPDTQSTKVLVAVARNQNTPVDALADLLSTVAAKRVRNHSDYEDAVESTCREMLANRSDGHLAAGHPDWRVRAVVASNESLPDSVRVVLAGDEDVSVSVAARR